MEKKHGVIPSADEKASERRKLGEERPETR
jgi:hypothetical protein